MFLFCFNKVQETTIIVFNRHNGKRAISKQHFMLFPQTSGLLLCGCWCEVSQRAVNRHKGK